MHIDITKEVNVERHYSTETVQGPDKAEVWSQLISKTFVELECSGMSSESFYGELRDRDVGELGITRITTDGYDVVRSNTSILTSSLDDFFVSIQMEGASTIRQLDREVVLKPGDFTMYDTTMWYHLHFERRSTQLVIKIPRAILKQYLQSPETLTALHVRRAVGPTQITTAFAKSLFDQTNNLNEPNTRLMCNMLLELITSSTREATSDKSRAPKSGATQLLQLKQFVSKNIRNADLTVGALAAAHSISDRHVHALFDIEGLTPARYIWNQRLNLAKSELCDPLLAHRSISEICFAAGFSDSAHFSRSFKKKFGVSPSAQRKQKNTS